MTETEQLFSCMPELTTIASYSCAKRRRRPWDELFFPFSSGKSEAALADPSVTVMRVADRILSYQMTVPLMQEAFEIIERAKKTCIYVLDPEVDDVGHLRSLERRRVEIPSNLHIGMTVRTRYDGDRLMKQFFEAAPRNGWINYVPHKPKTYISNELLINSPGKFPVVIGHLSLATDNSKLSLGSVRQAKKVCSGHGMPHMFSMWGRWLPRVQISPDVCPGESVDILSADLRPKLAELVHLTVLLDGGFDLVYPWHK